jgi:hypothetical protein
MKYNISYTENQDLHENVNKQRQINCFCVIYRTYNNARGKCKTRITKCNTTEANKTTLLLLLFLLSFYPNYQYKLTMYKLIWYKLNQVGELTMVTLTHLLCTYINLCPRMKTWRKQIEWWQQVDGIRIKLSASQRYYINHDK